MNKNNQKKQLIKSILKNGITILKQLPKTDSFLLGLKEMAIITSTYRSPLKKGLIKLLDSPELLLKSAFTILNPPTLPKHVNRQFRHKKWQEAPFCYYKKMFENTQNQLLTLIESLPNLSSFERKQVLFFTRVFFEMIAPYNHLLFHPQLLELTRTQKGENLLRGFANFISDLAIWGGYFAISRSPMDAFTPGQNIALTVGSVIHKTQLYELICFPAQTPNKQGTPLLLVTSWINKYYILDLKKRNSFIHWLTTQGFHVYTISWNMPDKNFKDYGFSDYVENGVLDAIDKIYQMYQKPLNVAGYCLGGTLLATAVAYLAHAQPDKIKSLSLFASMIDFEHAGTMKYLLGDEQIQAFEKSMQKVSYWHGRKMAAAFCLSDAENTYWPFYTRNYIQGEPAIAHELIYWAQDYTHSPEKLFSYYMRALYRDNVLTQPNKLQIDQQPINFKAIHAPVYCLGIQDDNLTPEKAAFASAKCFNNPVFILSEGTHVSGMLSTAKQTKLGFYQQEILANNTLETWKNTATYHKRSWWLHWLNWLNKQNPVALPSQQISLYPAPGEYILKKFTSP